jgi:hypothetical protein
MYKGQRLLSHNSRLLKPESKVDSFFLIRRNYDIYKTAQTAMLFKLLKYCEIITLMKKQLYKRIRYPPNNNNLRSNNSI